MSKINVVYLHSHDTGRYTSAYGHALRTPHVQKLAERGVLFRQAFCNNPTCSPSRACLLTGQVAHSNGMMGLAHRGGKLNDPSHMLPYFLRDAGYETAICGFQHVTGGESPLTMEQLGYSLDLSAQRDIKPAPTGSGDIATAAVAADFLRTRGQDQPFFLDVGFTTTHRTNKNGSNVQWHNGELSPQGDPRYVQVPACLPDTPETRADYADYAVAVTRLDDYIGRVLDALDEAGLTENTLVICTTDHGIAYPHMKCNLTAHGTGVMLTLAGAGFDGGAVVDSLVSHIDLFPTVCDVLGLDHPAWLQGQSLTPLRKDSAAVINDALFAEVNYHAAHEPKRSVRTKRHSYIRRITTRNHQVLPNCDDSVSKTVLLEAGWRDRSQVAEQLYDLVFDPTESHNVIDDPAYAEALADLRSRLDGWMQATDDPALTGRVELSGMTVNAAEADGPGSQGTTVT
ncbi:MAG: sulfatase [Planctomycetota bacterium]